MLVSRMRMALSDVGSVPEGANRLWRKKPPRNGSAE